jgi:polysaccharide export outer membrane protein
MTTAIRLIASASFIVALGCAASAQVSPAQGPRSTGTVGTTGTTAPPTADYRLVAGDKLRIEVYKDDKLSQSLQVRPDGKITLPLVGDIAAAGRTSLELRDAIATSLKEYNTNPVVTVIVLETVPPLIYVMGEVNDAGPQPLAGQMTVLQALAAAGGFKDFANTKNIRVLRQSPTGITTTIPFNYKDAIRGVIKPIVLQPGDTIIVP